MLEGSHPQEGLPPAHFGRRYNLGVFQGFSVQNMVPGEEVNELTLRGAVGPLDG